MYVFIHLFPNKNVNCINVFCNCQLIVEDKPLSRLMGMIIIIPSDSGSQTALRVPLEALGLLQVLLGIIFILDFISKKRFIIAYVLHSKEVFFYILVQFGNIQLQKCIRVPLKTHDLSSQTVSGAVRALDKCSRASVFTAHSREVSFRRETSSTES